MDTPSSLAIVSLAALIHASFQLSVSVLTLLSGHAIGSKKSHARLWRMTASFVVGAIVMTILLLSFTSLLIINIFNNDVPKLFWAISCGLTIGVAVSVWLFYYRKEKGTSLWIPRGFATYLNNRTKSTDLSAEAFGLGISSVVGEIIFIIAPLLISALTLVQLSAPWQLIGVLIYSFISSLPLITVWALIGGGHKLSDIQKWREANKNFLQFAAGAGLIVLAFFVYVNEIVFYSIGGM